jgi:hypothetical protein
MQLVRVWEIRKLVWSVMLLVVLLVVLSVMLLVVLLVALSVMLLVILLAQQSARLLVPQKSALKLVRTLADTFEVHSCIVVHP